jgi:hypothetical protein
MLPSMTGMAWGSILELDWAASMGRARIIAANVVRMKIGDRVRGFLFTVIPTRVRFQVK